MKNSGAPNFEQLVDWLEGRLSADEARATAEQVEKADEATQADVAWLRKFYQATERMTVAKPPAELSRRLEQRFAAFTRHRRPPSLRQRLVATLSFDSYASMARGVRAAASTENQRQIVYEADEATAVFTLQRRSYDQHINLIGQVLATDESEVDLVRVVLLRENEEFDSTITDDLGEFTLTALPPGLYDIVLSSAQYEITISSVDLSI